MNDDTKFRKLQLDISLGRFERLRERLASGLDPNSANDVQFTLLHCAVNCCQSDVARLLLDFGAHVDLPDVDGDTPLYLAALRGDLEIIRLLHERGANINHQTSAGFTPLNAAASAFSVGNYPIEAFIFLASSGADIDSIREDYPDMYRLALPHHERWVLGKSALTNRGSVIGLGL